MKVLLIVIFVLGFLLFGCASPSVSQTSQPIVNSEKENKLEQERAYVNTIHQNLNVKTKKYENDMNNFDIQQDSACKKFFDLSLDFLTYTSESNENASSSYKRIAKLLGENETCIQAINLFDNESRNYLIWEKQIISNAQALCDTDATGKNYADEESNRAKHVEEIANKMSEACPKVNQYVS